MSHGPLDHRKPLDQLRAFVRYETHGGYVWAAVMADGELMCETCALENYGQVYRQTLHPSCGHDSKQWRVMGITHSGYAEAGDIAQCAHCNKLLWSIDE
jgi:hypothetical protein